HAITGTGHDNVVGVVRALDDDRIDRTVTDTRSWRAGQVEIDVGQVRAAEVVDRDLIEAALGVAVDLLDAIEVHRDGADVSSEPNARAIGGDVHRLIDVRAIEDHGVMAIFAFNSVAAVTWIPLEHVIAGAHEGAVIALVAVDEIVTVAAEEEIETSA